MGLYNQVEEGVHTKKREYISFVQRREREEREEVREFVQKQLKKGYIQLLSYLRQHQCFL